MLHTTQTAPRWQVIFDEPHSLAIEPGYINACHARNLRVDREFVNQVWQDPNTGLWLLRPSFMTENFYDINQWKPLDQWQHTGQGWERVFRAPPWRNPTNPALDPAKFAATTAKFYTTTDDGVNEYGHFSNGLDLAFWLATKASEFTADVMKWEHESRFSLARDEGFVIYYHVTGDEHHRPRNWMYWQWDNLGLHFDYDGTCTAFLHNPDDPLAPGTPFDKFQFCTAGDIINKQGYIVVLPIPGFGLSIYHSLAAQQLDAVHSSATDGVTKGHLVRTPERQADNGAGLFVHDGGQVRMALGAVRGPVHHVMGFHSIAYFPPTDGVVFRGPIFDPGYRPSEDPICTAICVQAAPGAGEVNRRDVTCEPKTWNSSGDWTVPIPGKSATRDRQVRLHLRLKTSDLRYTPFVQGAAVQFSPHFNNRNTTPIKPWRIERLEFSEDEQGRFEGVVDCLHRTGAERKLVERGDTTFRVERSDDGGQTWKVQGGGLARLPEPFTVIMDRGGLYYRAKWKLSGMQARFAEIHALNTTSFEGLTIAGSVNTILAGCGFLEIPPEETPPELTDFTIPQSNDGAGASGWRYATKEGEKGSEVIRNVLLLARSQWVEWYVVYNWPGQKWEFWQRPYDLSDANYFALTPFPDEVDKVGIFPIADGTSMIGQGTVLPPEFNALQGVGFSTPDTSGEQLLAQPLYNWASLDDPTSPEYLGRVVYAKAAFFSTDTPIALARQTRMLAEAAGRRRFKFSAPSRDYVDKLRPNCRVDIRGLDEHKQRIVLFADMWLKRRTVVIDYTELGEIAPQITYALDSVWDTEELD